MELEDFLQFFNACEPSRALAMGNPEEQKYYIDFASVRGGKIIEAVGRTILLRSQLKQPSCQLFTGHIGCGKSTELSRLKTELEKQGFHVVYFASDEDLDMGDLDITDILLTIVRRVSESLEAIGIKVKPKYFANLFQEIVDVLQTPIEFSTVEFSLPGEIAKITAAAKNSPKLRTRLRSYLEPRTNGILQSINEEVLGRAIAKLQERGKKGLVVIIDNLDRVDVRAMPSGRLQPEYLFVDRGEQLSKLNCHLVYTIPLTLIFSNEGQTLQMRLGGGIPPKVLPMVPVRLRDGRDYEEGMARLRQMVLARAFPNLDEQQRLARITEVFDTPETLDRLCRISGGHVRQLLGLLYRCLQEENPPLSRKCLEGVIQEFRDILLRQIDEQEWDLLRQVVQQQHVKGEVEYQTLLRSLYVFEYPDPQGRWFWLNPVLTETEKFKSWQF